ncbi:sensor histidine kinase [Microbacterium sp. NPDC078428]|uniref:sensor histidine kinase n=1 Tax=Microbacterium sp. NPDC078428 TaxID=3364190 RepID=UPI0037CAB46D
MSRPTALHVSADRLQVFARSQLALFAAVVVLALGAAFAGPAVTGGILLAVGVLLVTAATIAALLLPGRAGVRERRFALLALAALATTDTVGIALMRTALLPELPVVDLLAVFPALWLAYGVRHEKAAVITATFSAVVMTLTPLLIATEFPGDPTEWVDVLALPVLVLLISLVVGIAARRMRATQEELATALEIREEFLRTASHELRTPLTPVAGYLSLLQEEHPEHTPTGRVLAVVQGSVDTLVDRVAALTSAADLSPKSNPRPVSLRTVAGASVNAARRAATQRGVTVQVEEAADAMAFADPDGVRTAIAELLDNAIKFSSAGSRVSVSWAAVDDLVVRLIVADDGPGMTADERSRAFERFYRTPAAREGAIGGFGLGLTRVRAIVEAHGGTVQLKQQHPRGVRAVVTLPAARG